MKALATILKNDSKTERVTLYEMPGDENVWAAGRDEEPYRTDVPLDRIGTAWGCESWDLEFCD